MGAVGVSNEIWEQLERIRSGEYEWSNRVPSRGQACVGHWLLPPPLGAFAASCSLRSPSMRLLEEVIAEQYPGHHYAYYGDWNDAPGRTQAEVEMVLEKAAIRLDEQQGLAP